jgi:EAL domain-containing protein (putative c-di-GMP-specific phosphodiesterase class I)/GGDEF domain-containing protein
MSVIKSNDSIIDLEQVQNIFFYLEFCTNSYVFVFDLEKDEFLISKKALIRFNFPSFRFSNALNAILKIVAPQDRSAFIHSVDKILSGRACNGLAFCHFIDRNGSVVLLQIRETIRHFEGVSCKILIGCLEDKTVPDFDEQTGLPLWKNAVSSFEKRFTDSGGVSGFFMELDIDDFNAIKERQGNDAGQKVIHLVADTCRQVCGKGTEVYSRDNNKFLFVNLKGGTAQIIKDLFSMIQREIEDIEYNLNYELLFTVSAGGITFFKYSDGMPDLIHKLDFSLSSAQGRGRNNLYLFNAGEYTAHLQKLDLREKLRAAVQGNFRGFILFYQPVIDARKLLEQNTAADKCIIGAEALLRWTSMETGLLGADKIIPILEENEMIIPVGRWILMKSFFQCAEWNKLYPDFHMSVNLSYIQLKKSNLLADIQFALERTKVNPENITLEVTESGDMDNKVMQDILAELSKLHLKIDIDDFGTGYSNLRYIQDLHANTLKLDYTFIHKAVKFGGRDQKMIEYITRMAHDLGMSVCMEGVETNQDLEKLKDMMPDKFQGFLFGRPVNAESFEQENLKIDNN